MALKRATLKCDKIELGFLIDAVRAARATYEVVRATETSRLVSDSIAIWARLERDLRSKGLETWNEDPWEFRLPCSQEQSAGPVRAPK
jgi:hypothetical protein